MRHILYGNEIELHSWDEEDTTCECNPISIVDKVTGDLFLVHRPRTEKNLTKRDVDQILALQLLQHVEAEGNFLINEEDE